MRAPIRHVHGNANLIARKAFETQDIPAGEERATFSDSETLAIKFNAARHCLASPVGAAF
jgi:hypothetical protein